MGGGRWEVWGDGTRVIDRTTRVAAMQRTLAQADPDRLGGIGANPGTVDALCSLASRALPWLPLEDGDLARDEAGLTGAECAALSLVGDYARAIHAMGFVEGSEAMARVAGVMGEQGVTVPPVAFDGFRAFPRGLRELALGLAVACDVTIAAHLPNEFAAEGLRHDLGMLVTAAEVRGLATQELEGEGDARCRAVERPRELGEVLSSLYGAREGRASASGAVSLLLPAGPLAEAESVARSIRSLVDGGCRSVVVAASDEGRAWRELAPKLVARGVSVRAQLSARVPSTEAGRAFLEFAESVAALSDLAEGWPPAEDVEEGTLVHLGDMSWWPPRAADDFLRCGSPTSPRRAPSRSTGRGAATACSPRATCSTRSSTPAAPAPRSPVQRASCSGVGWGPRRRGSSRPMPRARSLASWRTTSPTTRARRARSTLPGRTPWRVRSPRVRSPP